MTEEQKRKLILERLHAPWGGKRYLTPRGSGDRTRLKSYHLHLEGGKRKKDRFSRIGGGKTAPRGFPASSFILFLEGERKGREPYSF